MVDLKLVINIGLKHFSENAKQYIFPLRDLLCAAFKLIEKCVRDRRMIDKVEKILCNVVLKDFVELN